MKNARRTLAILMLLSILVSAIGITAFADGPNVPEGHKQLDYVESISVTGEGNTLNTAVAYPTNTTIHLSFSFVPDEDVTRVLVVARPFAPGTAIHDASKGFVWVDLYDEEWSARCDEGMNATVTKEGDVYYVTATYTTPEETANSMYLHLYSDNGTTEFANILTTCEDNQDAPADPNEGKTQLDHVETITVTGEGNTLNTSVAYPADSVINFSFSFTTDGNVTRVLAVARPFAPGTAVHDSSKGFVWVDINGSEWSSRCDEGMTATVTKEGDVYHVQGFYRTPDVAVESMYFHLYSDNGTTVFTDIKTYSDKVETPEPPATEPPATEPPVEEPPKTGDISTVIFALLSVSAVAVCLLGNKKRSV